MKRVNYVVTPFEKAIGTRTFAAVPAALAPSLRSVAAALLAVAAMAAVQERRIAAARVEGAVAAARLARADARTVRVHALARERDRLRALAEHVAAVERSGPAWASEIAAIGNGVPRDVWLSSLHVQAGNVAIEGRGARLAAVGTAMAALVRVPAFGAARLLSVRENDDRSGISYAIELERR